MSLINLTGALFVEKHSNVHKILRSTIRLMRMMALQLTMGKMGKVLMDNPDIRDKMDMEVLVANQEVSAFLITFFFFSLLLLILFF
jgi:hypothetical protein